MSSCILVPLEEISSAVSAVPLLFVYVHCNNACPFAECRLSRNTTGQHMSILDPHFGQAKLAATGYLNLVTAIISMGNLEAYDSH